MDNTKNHKFRPTIHKIFRLGRDRKGSVVSVEDALNQGKLKFTAASFGGGSADYVYCNVDFDEALMLAHTLLNGTFSRVFPVNEVQKFGDDTVLGEYVAYKGSPKSDQYGGKPESRIIEFRGMVTTKLVSAAKYDSTSGAKISDAVYKYTPKYSISMWVGPGKLTDTGAVMPAVSKSQMISQRLYLSQPDMIKLMLKIKLHVEAYYASNFQDMYNPKDGTIVKGFRVDGFTDPNAPRHVSVEPVVEQPEYHEETPSVYGEDTTPAPTSEPEPEVKPDVSEFDLDI